MKLEVGMYVRDKGTIKKIESIHKNCEGYKTEISLTKTYPRLQDYEIKKASFNLIDLIEVGDYVNGRQVYFIKDDELYEECIHGMYQIKEIKEILTHEQYNSNKYVIGGDKNE